MRKHFIQFLLLLVFNIPTLSLGKNPPDQKAIKWAKSQLTRLNFEQQLHQMLWINGSSNSNNNYGGVVTNEPENIIEENKRLISYSILNVNQGIEASTNSPIPFPSINIRKELTPLAYNYAKYVYKTDLVIDIEPPEGIIFYGINLNESIPTLTPHFKKDSLSIALSLYDQIWIIAEPTELIKNVTGRKKPSKKFKKTIYNLALKALIKKYEIRESIKLESSSVDIDDYTRWAWNQYSSRILLINNPGGLPIKTLDQGYFCTTALDNEFYILNRHLNFYVTHANHPNALDISSSENIKKLSNYDYIIVPGTTITEIQLKNINELSVNTKIFLVWFSNNPPPKELSANITQIVVPELNGATESLVPQLIFGALGFVSNESNISYAPPTVSTLPNGRLQFGPPALAYLATETLRKIDTLVENSIRQQATPGSQVLVAKNGIVVYYQNFGHKTYKSPDAIKDYYLYDLASLTKVMATTQALMFLTERGMIDLDKPIAHYLPEMWGTDKAFIPIREILAHQAGLYPYIPFWKEVLPKRDLETALTHKKSINAYQIGKNTYIAPYLQDSILSWSIHSKRLHKSNAEQPYGYRYSDIGFIILKTLVERLVNQPLDDFLDQNLYAPLGMNRTTFTPLCKFSEDDIVPTEGNGKFRMGELTGYVHDQNAALIGGVSGHAGLFSNALDLAKLMQLQIQLGTYGGTTYLYPETILNFTKRQYVGNRRGLGWDKPSRQPNGPTTDLASQQTFGHTGFTGTAAWADPEHQLIFIFLSNRVYPDAENFKLNQLNIRTRIQGLLYEAIDFNN
jgi:beta-N-acetylhexosaminidase